MKHQPIGACVVILNDKDQILLGKRKNSYLAGWYGIPGGRIELNEAIDSAAVREVKEETHLNCDNLNYIGVVRELQGPEDGRYSFIHFAFMCKNYSGKLKNVEPDKCEGWEWFNVDKIPEKIVPGHKAAIEMFLKKDLQSYRDLL